MAYGSAFDPLTGRFVLVLEDLAVDDCEFPDTLHPLSKDQAASIVELLARLHAAFWARVPGWLYTASADSTSLLVGLLLKTSARRLAERTDIPVDNGRFIDENYRAVARLIDTPPHSVMMSRQYLIPGWPKLIGDDRRWSQLWEPWPCPRCRCAPRPI